jgi:hypothetical protein
LVHDVAPDTLNLPDGQMSAAGVGDTAPAVQAKPALHAAVHAENARPLLLPKRPALQLLHDDAPGPLN